MASQDEGLGVLCVDTNGRITVFGDEVVGVVRTGAQGYGNCMC